jgi:tripartite-type tricarboxylate transporter receptor subunit TctC
VIGGSVQLIFTGAPALIGHIRSGQLTALAVSSPKRLDILPDVPTVAEALGLRGFEADQWYGLVAPAGTPRDIVMKLNRAVNEALGSEALKVRLNTEGAIATPTTPEEFGKLIASDIERWRPVITSGRVRVD